MSSDHRAGIVYGQNNIPKGRETENRWKRNPYRTGSRTNITGQVELLEKERE